MSMLSQMLQFNKPNVDVELSDAHMWTVTRFFVNIPKRMFVERKNSFLSNALELRLIDKIDKILTHTFAGWFMPHKISSWVTSSSKLISAILCV